MGIFAGLVVEGFMRYCVGVNSNRRWNGLGTTFFDSVAILESDTWECVWIPQGDVASSLAGAYEGVGETDIVGIWCDLGGYVFKFKPYIVAKDLSFIRSQKGVDTYCIGNVLIFELAEALSVGGKRFELGFAEYSFVLAYNYHSLDNLWCFSVLLDDTYRYHRVSVWYDNLLWQAVAVGIDEKEICINEAYLGCWNNLQGLRAKQGLFGVGNKIF